MPEVLINHNSYPSKWKKLNAPKYKIEYENYEFCIMRIAKFPHHEKGEKKSFTKQSYSHS
jgi:hypothetical protein